MKRATAERRRTSASPRFLLLFLFSACAQRSGNDLSALLVTLDTTRPDALSCYAGSAPSAPGRPVTPALESLAREGVVFDRAYTSAPLTLPAHASLLSGLFPLRHGLRDNGRGSLPAAARTLAEAARDAGLQTAAFVGAAPLDRAFGLDQGFQVYDAPAAQPGDPAGKEAERPAREVVDRALSWLAARDRARPFFLWVHVYDAHTPYEPPEDLRGKTVRQNYLGEVASADRELARLFSALRAEGALDRTLVLVAGDHGEALGEHGEEGHSVHCYETTLRVPLIVRAPFWTRLGPGARTDELVGLVDVLPTVCEALELDPSPGPAPGSGGPVGTPPDGTPLDGRSFWSAPAPPDRGLYFESYYGFLNFGWSPLAGWLDARGKYLHASDPRYFDLRADPLEERDLSSERAAEVNAAQRAIATLAEKPVLASSAPSAGEELLESLRGLGYAGFEGAAETLPHPLAETGLPSPERMRATYAKALRGLELGKGGDVAGAERLFREVLEENPKNPFALDQLAVCQLQTKRFAEAESTLRVLLALAPDSAGTWFKLAACASALERPSEAIQALEHAVALAPKSGKYRLELARLLRAAGRGEEAARLERELQEPGAGS